MTIKAWDLDDPKARIIAEHGCGWVAWKWTIDLEGGAVMMSRSYATAEAALADLEEFLEQPKEWPDE